MKYDTAGNPIYEPIQNCDCGLTGGCEKCNPFFQKKWSILDEVPITKEEYDYYEKLPSFIGSITDEEAEEMKKKVDDWNRRFNEDMERKSKILFPSHLKDKEMKKEEMKNKYG